MKKRIGLIGDNSVEFIIRLIDIWNQGKCAVVIDWRIPLDTAMKMLTEAGVEECYIDSNVLKENTSYRHIKITTYKSSRIVACIPQEVQASFVSNYSQEEALILFSSGTTGKAKGVILSHYAINKNAEAVIKYMELEQDDCIYLLKTFAHSATIVGELLVGLKSRIKMVVAPTIMSVGVNLSNMIAYKATIVGMNPTLLKVYSTAQKIKKQDLSSLRVIYFSGSIVEKTIIKEASACFSSAQVLNVYGLSEAGPRVAAQTLSSKTNKLGGVGRAIEGVEIKILNAQGTEAKILEKGKIYVATEYISKGYVNRSSGLKMLDEKWLETGDVGYFDEDGELFITGRADNMVIVGSHNIYVEEIEDFIQSLDGVQDCVVLSRKNETYGEKIYCCYVSDKDLTGVLISQCRKRLAPYEIPDTFIRADKLFTNLNGKKIRNINMYLQEGNDG